MGTYAHPVHFLFENASLVDFQIGNEHLCRHGAHVLFETASLVDVQIGNAHLCRPVAHFLLGKRSLVDFKIGNEGEGCNGRDPGVWDRILSTQRKSGRPRSDFLYTKNSALTGSDFIYTKTF